MSNIGVSRYRAMMMIAPAAIVMMVVTGYPICHAFWLSVHQVSLISSGVGPFIGIKNYQTVLVDHYWWSALAVTIVITVISVGIEFILGFGLALVMHYGPLMRNTIRTSILVPYGIVTVVAAYSWYYAWTPETGYLMVLLPQDMAPLTHRIWAIGIIILAEVWKTTPFMALLLLAGLALVPHEVLQAACMDGAGHGYQLIHIMVPIMKPAITVAILLRSLDAFRVFDSIYILTNGQNHTESVSILGYDNLFKGFNLGLGSAISILIFLCTVVIALIVMLIMRSGSLADQ